MALFFFILLFFSFLSELLEYSSQEWVGGWGVFVELPWCNIRSNLDYCFD